ncbi:MAG: cobalamin B12-binding domain-containing protein [Deltaproteobacteria bacterium]|nr:cobalamin B12-binding domain-containing protein [Deltaproteobacteria bacterium]
MKVLLVSTNRSAVPFPVYPLGLDFVAGALADRHEVTLLDLLADERLDALEATLRSSVPDVVGLSIRNVDNTDGTNPEGFVEDARRAAASVRRASGARVVLGGSGFGIFPAELLAATGADAGIVGEGERVGALLDAWERGADAAGLPGVVLRDAPVLRTGPWQGPRRRRWRAEAPHVAFYLRHGGMLNLQSRRGCPHACTYCTYPLLEGRASRPVPPRDVAAEARALQDAGARFLFFADSTFNVDPPHNLAVAAALRAAEVRLPWGAFFAPSAPERGYFGSLAAAGLTHVEFGTESLSAPMLTSFGKWFSPDDVREAHAAARAAGLNVAHYFLLGGPGETAATLSETLEGAERLDRCARFFFPAPRIFPDTPLARRAQAEGRLRPGHELLPPTFYRCDVPAEEILGMVRARAAGRLDWVAGSGGERLARVAVRLHARGETGPLWERLIG